MLLSVGLSVDVSISFFVSFSVDTIVSTVALVDGKAVGLLVAVVGIGGASV